MPLHLPMYSSTYTPTATGITLSTGTITGRYTVSGKLCTVVITYTWNTGDTFGGAGVPFVFTLPVAAATALEGSEIRCMFDDASADAGYLVYVATRAADTTHTPKIWYGAINTTPNPDVIGNSTWATTQPVTWANPDRFTVSASYATV